MRSVDSDEPLEYLTEMRHIVILFMNVVTHKIDITEFVNLVDKCYKIVCGYKNETTSLLYFNVFLLRQHCRGNGGMRQQSVAVRQRFNVCGYIRI